MAAAKAATAGRIRAALSAPSDGAALWKVEAVLMETEEPEVADLAELAEVTELADLAELAEVAEVSTVLMLELGAALVGGVGFEAVELELVELLPEAAVVTEQGAVTVMVVPAETVV